VQTKLNPYLSFKDTARQAIEFYHSVFGGELRISTFKDSGASMDPIDDDKVMHSQLDAPNGITLMVSDTPVGHE
jgi:PhnB protein